MNLNADDIRGAIFCILELRRRMEDNDETVKPWLHQVAARYENALRMTRTRQQIACGDEQLDKEDETWIGSAEAAHILGWKIRQVQRHQTDLDGQFISGRLAFRQSRICEYAEEMNDARASA
jgi:hypothetical protein